MRDRSIQRFAADLADRTPAPGGGAAAAIQLAFGAGLVAMLARFSDSAAIAEAADGLRAAALHLADDDVAAYAEVLAAYRLDRADPARPAVIAAALAAAARPPAAVIEAAAGVIDLAERLMPIGNHLVIMDAVAGVQAARAAIVTSQVNVAANVKDSLVRPEFGPTLDLVPDLLRRADALTASVLRRVE